MRHADGPDPKKLFESESFWPFVLNRTAMDKCLEFVCQSTDGTPKIVRIFGESGSGKSFFTRELLAQIAPILDGAVGIYLDFPPADLSAASVMKKIDELLTLPRTSERAFPDFVPGDIAKKWGSRRKRRTEWRRSYGYGVVRDLTGQIPVAGPFIKAVLPSSLPPRLTSGEPEFDALRFLLQESHSRPIAIALDNTQFIPPLLREILNREFISAGRNIILILVERSGSGAPSNWEPAIKNSKKISINLGTISAENVREIVQIVLPFRSDADTVADLLYRRSEGNLKSVWFQLKFIVERNESQDILKAATSYEDVIQSLGSAEQLVLRIVVVLLGGISTPQMVSLCKALNIGIEPGVVAQAINDLAALGLIIKNDENPEKFRVEHEIVSKTLRELTPEDEKLEFQHHIIYAISRVLEETRYSADNNMLYDRLLGIAVQSDIRKSAALQIHISSYLNNKYNEEHFSYLATILRDSVCWDILDILPQHTIEYLLISLQRCSLFDFGLVTVANIKNSCRNSEFALIYEAKYLVQLFLYEKAHRALTHVPPSKDRDLIEFTITLNQGEDELAAATAMATFTNFRPTNSSEAELIILRNSGHLFDTTTAKAILDTCIKGFQRVGSQFGIATTLNNQAILDICIQDYDRATEKLKQAYNIMYNIGSSEIYQSIVNLGGISFMQRDYARALEFILEADRFTSRSLSMDMAMLQANRSSLCFLLGKFAPADLLDAYRNVHADALKTKDVRFAETIGWFLNQLEGVVIGKGHTEFSNEILSRVLDDNFGGMEVFLDVDIIDRSVKVPYFLSPHWRH